MGSYVRRGAVAGFAAHLLGCVGRRLWCPLHPGRLSPSRANPHLTTGPRIDRLI
jgi:hypothetical protein